VGSDFQIPINISDRSYDRLNQIRRRVTLGSDTDRTECMCRRQVHRRSRVFMEGCVDGVPRDSDNGQVRLWIIGTSNLSNGSANGIPIEVASGQRLVHDDHRLRAPLIEHREVAASDDGNAICRKPLRTDFVLEDASILNWTRRGTYRLKDRIPCIVAHRCVGRVRRVRYARQCTDRNQDAVAVVEGLPIG
jgi:hypothetical protein